MMDESLRADYLACKRVIDRYSKTFSIAFSVLPSPKKEAVWALYAFNRILDDAADQLGDKKALEEEHSRFTGLQQGKTPDLPQYRALADVNQRFGLNVQAMEAQFTGQFYDLDFKPFAGDAQLLEYCYWVAGSVGDMLLPIVAVENQSRLGQSSAYLGTALQLTNILRDVGEDYRNGRVYLPQDALVKFEVNQQELGLARPTENTIRLWEHYAQMAEGFYQKGLEELEWYDPDSRGAVKTAALAYKEILNAVRAQEYRLDKRAVVPKRVKLALLQTILGE